LKTVDYGRNSQALLLHVLPLHAIQAQLTYLLYKEALQLQLPPALTTVSFSFT
jgi:hypothetical protein